MPHGASRLQKALEELYQAPREEFIRKRDALAKALHDDGDDEGAQLVRARRKPTQIAWVLNQLSRRHPDAIAELVDVGRELLREQRKALRGESTGSFRETIARQREVVAALRQKTLDLMKDVGLSPSSHLDDINAALLSALVEPSLGAALEEGRLERVPHAATFGIGELGELSAPRAADAASGPRTMQRAGRAKTRASRASATAAKKAAAKARAAASAEKRKVLAKERAERAAAARDAKRAVAAARALLRNAEAKAKKQRLAAEKADAAARATLEHAKSLAEEAERSERLVEDAKKQLSRVVARTPA